MGLFWDEAFSLWCGGVYSVKVAVAGVCEGDVEEICWVVLGCRTVGGDRDVYVSVL